MEVGSVSSSLNSALNTQAQARVRQPETETQPPQAQQAQQNQQSQQAQQTRQAQPNQENESATQARAEAEKNRPTVNTSGQVVGTRVNTTA